MQSWAGITSPVWWRSVGLVQLMGSANLSPLNRARLSAFSITRGWGWFRSGGGSESEPEHVGVGNPGDGSWSWTCFCEAHDSDQDKLGRLLEMSLFEPLHIPWLRPGPGHSIPWSVKEPYINLSMVYKSWNQSSIRLTRSERHDARFQLMQSLVREVICH